ncbi:MAG: galactosyldiacylglycerol synthase [Nitrospiraceae bacterium]|nr:galactosyldiacylglycerol synthase [Nitrospiraceae bacterium]
MVKLYDNKTNKLLGSIADEQLQVLIDQLEEESGEDQDYYLNRETLDMLTRAGANGELLALLQQALGANGEGEIRWVRE